MKKTNEEKFDYTNLPFYRCDSSKQIQFQYSYNAWRYNYYNVSR